MKNKNEKSLPKTNQLSDEELKAASGGFRLRFGRAKNLMAFRVRRF